MNPIARRNARQFALQALYQWHMSGMTIDAIAIDFIERQIKKNTDIVYFQELVNNVAEKSSELDATMEPVLNIPLAELDPVELTILRISIYELAHRLDIPFRVVINEGLELAKRFGSTDGHKFVNGVLDQVARQLRSTEISHGKPT